MDDLAAYGSLFLAALLAATILPAQSEAVLGYLDSMGEYNAYVLLLLATTGNVLGSVVNWAMAATSSPSRSDAGSPSSLRKSTARRRGSSAGVSGPCCWRGRPSTAIR